MESDKKITGATFNWRLSYQHKHETHLTFTTTLYNAYLNNYSIGCEIENSNKIAIYLQKAREFCGKYFSTDVIISTSN